MYDGETSAGRWVVGWLGEMEMQLLGEVEDDGDDATARYVLHLNLLLLFFQCFVLLISASFFSPSGFGEAKCFWVSGGFDE